MGNWMQTLGARWLLVDAPDRGGGRGAAAAGRDPTPWCRTRRVRVDVAALGIGAIAGALVLGGVRRVLSTTATLTAAGVLMAASLLALVTIPSYPAALVIWVAGGCRGRRQHDGRLTGADRTVETAALSFSEPAATATHLLPRICPTSAPAA